MVQFFRTTLCVSFLPPLHYYNAVALPLLAAGQRFFAGTNKIQRLIDYHFATLPGISKVPLLKLVKVFKMLLKHSCLHKDKYVCRSLFLELQRQQVKK